MKNFKVGSKIKYYRNENRLTQQELGDRVGVTCEMISRYERGVNEPYGRIETIAKALNIEVGELLQNSYNNHIPLFTKIPKGLDFNPNNTTFYYTCPEWILKKDKGVFALDMSLVDSEQEGVYYISPDINPVMSKLVLIQKNQKLFVKEFQNQENIIGTILSFEEKTI